jgi:hypothetical protein
MEGIEVLQKIKSFFQSKQLSADQVSELISDGVAKELAQMPKGELSINYRNIFTVSYDGEKNVGEIGPPKDYQPDYNVLRIRSWQSYLESEIAQTVIKRFLTWMIGVGLKPQSEPAELVLESEKIKINSHEFSKIVEARLRNLNMLAKRAYKDAIVGGDTLVVLRYENNFVNVQLIDGAHVQSPIHATETYPMRLKNGNKISNGIECAPNGEHVCFYVKNAYGTFDIVQAYGEQSGIQMAFMIYGFEYRLDSTRGMPLLSVVFETLKKLERYKEAVVGSAEERQKIPYFIEHQNGSTGENPLLDDALHSAGMSDLSEVDPLSAEKINKLIKHIKATFNKQVLNMPVASTLKSLDTKNELYFKDFYTVNINLLCACISIPPDVALSKYDSNFSASRAALKDWENTLTVERDAFAFQFYKPIYNFWLLLEILSNKIQAPGFLEALIEGDQMVLEAYRMVRFVGTPVPHIDPEKEANAERVKLGTGADHLPMTTLEAATEALNGGESSANLKQFADESKIAEGLGIKPPVVAPPGGAPQVKKKSDQ